MAELGRTNGDLEMLVGWNASAPGGAFFSAGLDLASGTIRTVGGGVWQKADVDRYLVEHRRVVQEARRRCTQLKVLCDIRDWVVEGPHSATQFQQANQLLYNSGDRLAAIVASSLYKPYSRTALSASNPEAFVSTNAAETWLQAYQPPTLMAG